VRPQNISVCATDCGPHNRATNMGVHANTGGRAVGRSGGRAGMQIRAAALFINDSSRILMCVKDWANLSNQLNMHKIMVSIFLTIQATIFDTHGSFSKHVKRSVVFKFNAIYP
jgi:hypothetical protein